MNKISLSLILMLTLSACTTNPYTGERQASKAAIGAGAGAVIGAMLSSKSDRGKGALIGAAVGGGAGYYFDHQAALLRDRLQHTGVSVTRLPDGGIKLNMPGHISFPVNQSSVLPSFYEVLDSVALVFKEYKDTSIRIYGYTDSTGSDRYNQTLSEQRATSVMRYFAAQQISSGRMMAQGFGERYAIADNSTQSGRAMNRRVEINIVQL